MIEIANRMQQQTNVHLATAVGNHRLRAGSRSISFHLLAIVTHGQLRSIRRARQMHATSDIPQKTRWRAGIDIAQICVPEHRNLVISDGPWSREHFGDQAIYVDPRSPESIRAGLEQGLRSGRRNSSLSQHIRDHFLLPGSLTPLVAALESMHAAHS